MTRLAVVIALISAACIATPTGGVRVVGSSGPHPGYGPPPTRPVPMAGPGSTDPRLYADGEDLQWFSADDYLVSSRPDEGKPISELVVAKMIGAPSGPAGEARFVDAEGHELASGAYWRTHMADPAELAIGTRAFCPAATPFTPKVEVATKKADSRGHRWILAPVTDASHVPEGWVTIGRTLCDIRAVRTIVR